MGMAQPSKPQPGASACALYARLFTNKIPPSKITPSRATMAAKTLGIKMENNLDQEIATADF
jgi:hypothetical protein